MNTQIAQKILEVAKFPMSATAIAVKVGKHKAYQIQEELDYLVGNGSIVKDETGKFPTFTVAPTRTVTKTVKKAAEPVSALVEQDSAEINDSELPTGYSIVKDSRGNIKKSKSGDKTAVQIKTPTGSTYKVKIGSALLVINNTPVCTVNGETTAMSVIAKYASEKLGITSFTVSQLGVGTVAAKDIKNMCGVIDVTITKNNKAA